MAAACAANASPHARGCPHPAAAPHLQHARAALQHSTVSLSLSLSLSLCVCVCVCACVWNARARAHTPALTRRPRHRSRPQGYTWVTFYALMMAVEIAYGKHLVGPHLGFASSWGPTLYTNALSILPMTTWGVLTGEPARLSSVQWSLSTVLLLLLSCVLGVALSFVGWRARSLISATCFSVLGVANKMLTVSASIFFFSEHASAVGVCFLFVCLYGAASYQQAPLSSEVPPSQRGLLLERHAECQRCPLLHTAASKQYAAWRQAPAKRRLAVGSGALACVLGVALAAGVLRVNARPTGGSGGAGLTEADRAMASEIRRDERWRPSMNGCQRELTSVKRHGHVFHDFSVSGGLGNKLDKLWAALEVSALLNRTLMVRTAGNPLGEALKIGTSTHRYAHLIVWGGVANAPPKPETRRCERRYADFIPRCREQAGRCAMVLRRTPAWTLATTLTPPPPPPFHTHTPLSGQVREGAA